MFRVPEEEGVTEREVWSGRGWLARQINAVLESRSGVAWVLRASAGHENRLRL